MPGKGSGRGGAGHMRRPAEPLTSEEEPRRGSRETGLHKPWALRARGAGAAASGAAASTRGLKLLSTRA